MYNSEMNGTPSTGDEHLHRTKDRSKDVGLTAVLWMEMLHQSNGVDLSIAMARRSVDRPHVTVCLRCLPQEGLQHYNPARRGNFLSGLLRVHCNLLYKWLVRKSIFDLSMFEVSNEINEFVIDTKLLTKHTIKEGRIRKGSKNQE